MLQKTKSIGNVFKPGFKAALRPTQYQIPKFCITSLQCVFLNEFTYQSHISPLVHRGTVVRQVASQYEILTIFKRSREYLDSFLLIAPETLLNLKKMT